MRKLAAVCVAVALIASGCGKSTSEGEDSSSSTSLATETSSSSAAPSSEDSASSSEASSPSAGAPKDKSTREIDSLPTTPPPRQPKEQKYLDSLQGITTDGVEDQLIVAAQEVCSVGQDSVIVGAIAGQLISLGHADGEKKDVQDRIAAAAKKAYC